MLYVRDFKPFGLLDIESALRSAKNEISKLNKSIDVDVNETETQYELVANLPGVPKENVEITMKNGLLTISVKQEDVVEQEGVKSLLRERRVVNNTRVLNFGDKASNEIRAKLENGVLTLNIDKVNPEDGVKKIVLE